MRKDREMSQRMGKTSSDETDGQLHAKKKKARATDLCRKKKRRKNVRMGLWIRLQRTRNPDSVEREGGDEKGHT